MLNTQLSQYFGLRANISNKTNDAEQGKYIVFKLGMLVILVCCHQTGTIQLEAKKLPKTNVAFKFEFVCRIASLKHYSSEIFYLINYDDFRMRKKNQKSYHCATHFTVCRYVYTGSKLRPQSVWKSCDFPE